MSHPTPAPTTDATFADDVLRSGLAVLVDFGAQPATAVTNAIQGMPTLILFKDGQPVARLVGAQPRTTILRQLEPHLTA